MNQPTDSLERKTIRQIFGRLGEDAVAQCYEAAGYHIVARNVHESHNEIDLIVADETHLVFVEVKTRHTIPGTRSRYGRPADAVNKGKRARTVAAAEAYLRAHCDEVSERQPRIDVAEVYMIKRSDGTHNIVDIQIFRNAFGAR